MPENRLFGGEQVKLLLDSARRRVVSSLFPAELSPVRRVAHEEWTREHSHAHPYAEVMVVLGGGGYHGWKGRVYRLEPGTVFVFSPMEAHDNGYRRGGARVEHLWVSVLRDHFVARVIRCEKADVTHCVLWNRVLAADDVGITPGVFAEGRLEGAPLEVARACVLGALHVLTSAIVAAGYSEGEARRDATFQSEIVRAIERHVRETAGRGVTLESVARIAGYSKYHFLRIFKQHVGLTLHQYVDVCRQERVRELASRGLSKRAISEALGFSHPAAFSRWERRHVRA